MLESCSPPENEKSSLLDASGEFLNQITLVFLADQRQGSVIVFACKPRSWT